jgi:hypothetical protein
MATLDITLSDDLKKLITPPACVDLRLPKPAKTELKLPTGGTIKPIPDITKGIPTDCAMNFNLMLQMAPIMASMECLLKVLDFLGVVVKLITKIADPKVLPPEKVTTVIGALPDLAEKGGKLMPCINMVIAPPLNIIPFIKSLLLMLARMLRCTAEALKSAIEILDGISLDMLTAQQDGNDALAQQLQCAQENAQLAMDGTMVSLEPVLIIMDIAKPFLEIAGVSLDIPPLASDGTLDGMKSLLDTIQTVGQTLEDVANGLPG